MDGWSKANVITIVGLLLSGGTAYGVMNSKVNEIYIKQTQNAKYVAEFIAVKTELHYLKDESVRTRQVWVKLDGTLDSLNNTLIRQGGEIEALKGTVDDIKKVVVKNAELIK